MRTLTTRLVGASTLLLVLTACAPRFLAVPTFTKEPAHAVLPEADVEARFNHMLKPLDEAKTVHYLQPYGGSVGVGLLLGPIGVAANIAAIDEKTTEEVAMLSGKLPWSPASLYAEVARTRPELSEPAGQEVVRVSPQLLLVKTDGEMLLLACVLQVDHRSVGQEWRGSYVFQTRQKFTLTEAARGLTPAQVRAGEAELAAGFRALTTIYFDDLRGKLGPGMDIEYKSRFVTPNMDIALKGKRVAGPEDRLVFRSVGTMYSLPREAATVAEPTPAVADQSGGPGGPGGPDREN